VFKRLLESPGKGEVSTDAPPPAVQISLRKREGVVVFTSRPYKARTNTAPGPQNPDKLLIAGQLSEMHPFGRLKQYPGTAGNFCKARMDYLNGQLANGQLFRFLRLPAPAPLFL
jgi:hypothetical protein